MLLIVRGSYPLNIHILGRIHPGGGNLIVSILAAKAGVYALTNTINGKQYIGSSYNLAARFREHLNGKKSNIPLQNAFRKYGLKAFLFQVLCFCDKGSTRALEQMALSLYLPAYNISMETSHPAPLWGSSLEGASAGGRFKHTPEHIASVSGENSSQAVAIYLYDLNKTFIKRFGTVTLAAKYLGVSHS
jgi:predicted GIY-YIG superfamily endonuclease